MSSQKIRIKLKAYDHKESPAITSFGWGAARAGSRRTRLRVARARENPRRTTTAVAGSRGVQPARAHIVGP